MLSESRGSLSYCYSISDIHDDINELTLINPSHLQTDVCGVKGMDLRNVSESSKRYKGSRVLPYLNNIYPFVEIPIFFFF